ncbi:MAG: DUF1214 domain-containing protein [Salinarimonas sp.]|nr:DUF1214 domain-containing protein [Salinarimonas sp.]
MSRGIREFTSSVYTILLVAYAVAGGAALGLYSAYRVVDSEFAFGVQQAGPWQVHPQIGTREIDPYARAILARTADIPLAAGEGLTFRASTDSLARPLRSECIYTISGTTPSARFWTLTLHDGDGRLPDGWQVQRLATTSARITRPEDGAMRVTISREPQPGNWLRVPDTEGFTIALRLYDTPAGGTLTRFTADMLPDIRRMGCPA